MRPFAAEAKPEPNGRPGHEGPLMRLEGLEKVYAMGDQEVRALDGVSLEMQQGEFVAIMGPSGSGKSTMMHILGLLDGPTAGSYFLDGEETAGLDEIDLARIRNRTIGFVFQSYNLLPSFTAVENVELPMVYGGFRGRRERAVQALERVGLASRLHHKPTELSGGQQQRVAIARAIGSSPRILMADEPTGNVSTQQGEEIMQIFQELNDDGVSVILVTHEPDIARHAHRLVQLRDGKIVSDRPILHRLLARDWLADPENNTSGLLEL